MSDKTLEQKQSAKQDPTPASEQTAEKKEYKKPELRKYTQIDYVTAYGVD